MKLDQLYYTSCRRGLSSVSGYQTRTMSAELFIEDRREIENKSGYRLPQDLELAPLDSLTDERLPVAYRIYRLHSGRFVLTRSAYVGQDYTGRRGNFYAHSIVFEKEPPTGVWPLSFWRWPGWLPPLTAEEDGMELPPPLPILELPDSAPVGALSPAELSAFLRGLSEARRHFPKMLVSLFRSQKDGRLLLIRDTPKNNTLWFACLQFSLPSAAAWRLTWSSYQHDPRGISQINAICGETTNYRLDRNARDFQYYLFDFTAGQFSAVTEDSDDYARRVTGWLFDEPSTLEEFHRFSALFAGDNLLNQLPGVLTLFRMVRGEDGWSKEDWSKAAELVRENLDASARNGLLEQFQSHAKRVSDDTLIPWFSFYVELASGGNAPLPILEQDFLRRLLRLADATQLGRQMARVARGGNGRLQAVAEMVQNAYYAAAPAASAGLSLRQFGAGFLEHLPFSSEGLIIRKELETIGCYDILLGEWDSRLAIRNHPLVTWREYRNNVLEYLPEFSLEHGALIAESAWKKAIHTGSVEEMAQQWCEQDDLALLSPAMRGEIIQMAFQSLPFAFADKPDDREKRIQDLAKRWNVALPDYRDNLRALWQVPRTGVSMAKAVEYASALRNLSNPQYLSLLSDYFPVLFLACPRRESGDLLAGLTAALDPLREAEGFEALGRSLEYLQRQENGFRHRFLELWLGGLAKSLHLEARLRLLPRVAGLYLDDAGLKLLAEQKPGEYRDELLHECDVLGLMYAYSRLLSKRETDKPQDKLSIKSDIPQLQHTPSFGNQLQGVLSAGLKMFGLGRHEQRDSNQPDLPSSRPLRDYQHEAPDGTSGDKSDNQGKQRKR